jgi:hypothetical protein
MYISRLPNEFKQLWLPLNDECNGPRNIGSRCRNRSTQRNSFVVHVTLDRNEMDELTKRGAKALRTTFPESVEPSPGHRGLFTTKFAGLENKIPKLLAQMRQDLLAHPLWRIFSLSNCAGRYRFKKTEFEYYDVDHKDLDHQLCILQSSGLVVSIGAPNSRRYGMTEELFDYLVGPPAQIDEPAVVDLQGGETICHLTTAQPGATGDRLVSNPVVNSFADADFVRAAVKSNSLAKRRNPRYAKIDTVLRAISESHPKGHKDVFELLEGRVSVPDADPFRSARGWINGFNSDSAAARAWLSKAWKRLDLTPFPRGPK